MLLTADLRGIHLSMSWNDIWCTKGHLLKARIWPASNNHSTHSSINVGCSVPRLKIEGLCELAPTSHRRPLLTPIFSWTSFCPSHSHLGLILWDIFSAVAASAFPFAGLTPKKKFLPDRPTQRRTTGNGREGEECKEAVTLFDKNKAMAPQYLQLS